MTKKRSNRNIPSERFLFISAANIHYNAANPFRGVRLTWAVFDDCCSIIAAQFHPQVFENLRNELNKSEWQLKKAITSMTVYRTANPTYRAAILRDLPAFVKGEVN